MDYDALIAIGILIPVITYGIWSHRNDPDFWTPEAIRQRSRVARRWIVFVPSVACVPLFTWLAFTRGPADALSAGFFALVAYPVRPDWLRHKSPVNLPAPILEDTPKSN